jgi:8-oxo-dGTP pyrophosphatase MutT (NUDIX family)
VIHDDYLVLREDARSVLRGWRAPDGEQAQVRDAYLGFLDEHPDAMSRSCLSGHLTASALVMDEHRTRVLLTLHPKAGRWLQLGGHCEVGDPSLRAAAHREVIEESGIADVTMSAEPLHLDRHPITCTGGPSEHLDVQYLATVAADAQEVMSDESDDLRWFALDDLPPDLDRAVRAMINAAVGGDLSGR